MRTDLPGVSLHLAAAPRVAQGGSSRPLAALDASLLAWLALEGATPRARLAQLLWPDRDAQAARNSLRQRLFQLRRSLGVELVTGTATLALAEGVTHDLEDADTVLGETAGEDLAAGEFAQWLAQQRLRRHERVRQSLAELAGMAERAQDWDDALTHARELLALDPLSEEAHRRVMRLHYLAGDPAAALRAFDVCERVLKDEVGTRPSAETLAVLDLIGRAPPVEAQRAHVLPATLLRPPALVGRDAELEALRAAWHAEQPFLLLGEAGIGKSRLLEALVQAWPGACIVRARPGDRASPLALLMRLIDALGHVRPALRAHPARARLLASLQPGDTERLTPQPLAAPLAELLHAAAADDRPVGLLLDDWQFADSASVELVGEALPVALRVGHASRVEGDAVTQARIAALRQQADRQVVLLAPWPQAGVEALLESLALPAHALAQALHRRVGGSPLYLLEALRRMHDQRLPMEARHVAAPRRVRELVATRLARLADDERRLLRIAVVAGDDFGVELAEAVSGRDALALADHWHRLEHLGLLEGSAIAHDVYAEVVQEQVPAPIACTLHARIAAWLESSAAPPRDGAAAAARLAAHWRAAGEHARAVPHLLAAARLAWRAARGSDAFDLFRQAAEIEAALGHPDAAFDHWFDNADAMSEVGEPRLYDTCVQGLAPLARHEGQKLRLRMVQAVRRWQSGAVEEGLAAVASLLTDAIALGDTRVEGECRFALAHRAAADGRLDEAVQQLAAGERVLRERGEARRAATLAASIALVIGIRGQPRLAQAEQERVLPLIEQQHDHATACVVMASKALQQVRQRELAGGVECALEALRRLGQVSIGPTDLALASGYAIEALRWAGRFDAALEAAQALQARLGAIDAEAFGAAAPAALYLHLGRVDRAHALIEQLAKHRPSRRRERARLALLQLQAACMAGTTPSVEPDAAPDPTIDLALAAEWALWQGVREVSQGDAAPARALAETALASRFVLLGEPLDALARWRNAQAGQPAPPRHAPEAVGAGAPWTALFEARAAQLHGDEAHARAWAQAGAAWLRRCAAQAVPPAMSHSFLDHHPAHRELLALAVRLGAC